MQAEDSDWESRSRQSPVTSQKYRLSAWLCHLSSVICKLQAASCELPSSHADRKGPSLPRLRRPRIRTRVVLRSLRRPGRPACQSVVEPSHPGVECRRLGHLPGTDPQQHSCPTRGQGPQRRRNRHLRPDSVTVAQPLHRPSTTRIPPRRGVGADPNPPQEQAVTFCAEAAAGSKTPSGRDEAATQTARAGGLRLEQYAIRQSGVGRCRSRRTPLQSAFGGLTPPRGCRVAR